MKCKSIYLKFYFLFLIFIVSSLTAFAQKNTSNLKSIWENAQKSDSIRFDAINKFYEKNTYSQPDSVIQVTDFHFELANKKANNKEKIKALNEKSIVYFITAKLVQAEEVVLEAIKIQSSFNDSVSLARLYTNLASIYRGQSKFVETIKYYNYALTIFGDTKQEKFQAAVLGNLGLVYFDLKNNELALDYLEKSLKIYEKLNLQDKVGYISLNIGAADFEKENFKQSIEHTEKALKIFEENNNLYATENCYALLAKSYQKTSNIEKAFFAVNKSLVISQQLKSTTKIIQNKILIAELYLDSDVKKASQIGEEVLAMLNSSVDKKTKASLYNLLYNCYKREGKIELSHNMYDKYIVYNDSIVQEQSNLELIKEAVSQEFKNELSKSKRSFEQSEKDLKRNQFIKLLLIVFIFLLLAFAIYIYSRKKNEADRKKNEELLEEIKALKRNSSSSLVVNSNEFELVREKIEDSINRKLNETDWKVLNILLKEPDIANKEIAEKAYLSIDGIGSSLRRMYLYFDIKESKYKKTSLIMEAIKASNK